MRKLILFFLMVSCMFCLSACYNSLVENNTISTDLQTNNDSSQIINTVKTNLSTYNELSDGTYECAGYIYKYRLEIAGTMPNAAVKSTFVYLSNIENISFDQAWKAAGLSSNMADYFAVNEAILVEIKTE